MGKIYWEMRWEKSNADLLRLSRLIEEFFWNKGFAVKTLKLDGVYRIVARPRKVHEIVGNIEVTIEGDAEDFCVRLLSSNSSRVFIFLGSLFSFLGFGFLASRGYKSEENLDKLRREFKAFVAEKVWEISNPSF